MTDFNHNDQQPDHVDPETSDNMPPNDSYREAHYRTAEETEAKKSSRILPLWLSGIVGGLTVAIIGFLLLFTGMIPMMEDTTVETNGAQQSMIQIDSSDDGITTDTLSNIGEAVVGIANIQTRDLWSDSRDAGTGSGVIYKVEGDRAYIVTNHHVIDGATDIEVILADGDRVPATLHGSDDLTDLAVLSMDESHATTIAPFGSSDDLVVGETAIAIGNPLGTEFAGTVTKGIISGLNRSLAVDINQDGQADWTVDVIQTDAAINPGNSGGALINARGEVIGINSMKIALGTVEGIGFAIPVDEAQPIIEQLEMEGQVARPFMGISAIDFSTVPPQHVTNTLNLDPEEVNSGIVIADVHDGSAAELAGLEVYDVIVEIDETPIESMMDLRQYLYQQTEVDDVITVSFYRNGEYNQTDVTLVSE